MRKHMLACLLAAMPLLAVAVAADTVSLPPGVVKPPFFDKQGISVLSYQKGPSGLSVWKVERNGVRTLFYTTADNKTLISGVAWDAKTGSNLSDGFITPDMQTTAQAQPSIDTSQFSPTKIPDAIKGVDSLVGIKEGKGPMDKTLYIMFDPRCPHCHAAYKKTRQFVANGGTIKWIPVTVLGRPDEGARLVADILQATSQAQALAAAMGGSAKGSQPNAQTLKVISENEAYFWAAYDRNKAAGTAGVPVAFFVTKQGVPQMVGGIDDDILLQQIFADIKK